MSKRIMVVEDETDIRDTICELLNEEAYTTAGFENGFTAAMALTEGTYSPDLVVLDLNMPRMNGLEFLQSSEKLGREIPVVLLTASKSFKEVLDLNREVRIVKKPVDLDQFLNVVKICAR